MVIKNTDMSPLEIKKKTKFNFCHHHGAINPTLHQDLTGTRDPDQSAAPATRIWRGDQPIQVISLRKKNNQQARENN